MPKLNLSADDVLTTTRAVRKRMDFDKPIEMSTIEECLEIALQAPTGSNGQQWEWVVVTDPEKIAAIGAMYQQGFAAYLEMEGSVKSIYKGDDPERIAQQEYPDCDPRPIEIVAGRMLPVPRSRAVLRARDLHRGEFARVAQRNGAEAFS